MSNMELLKNDDFWAHLELVWKTIKVRTEEYPEGFALNFGEWETVLAKNKYASDCHGHCHVFLSYSCVKKLEKLVKWTGLQGRYDDPENYHLKNVAELEVNRLLASETSDLGAKFQLLEERLENKINNLEKKMDERFNDLVNLIQNLDFNVKNNQ
jgi:hypothetical protein